MKKIELCVTGNCPPVRDREDAARVKISEGNGGREMQTLLSSIFKQLPEAQDWNNTHDDGATFSIGEQHLVFTTDTYTVTPLFFPGGDIGTLAFCGTVNDLSVMGAKPIGLSLSYILEEGLEKEKLMRVTETIANLAKEHGIPIVTGDTKVLEKGAVDGMLITTSGVGLTDRVLDDALQPGDVIIVSGGIGEHGAALLAKRFEMETLLQTDSATLHREVEAVRPLIKQAKDITRGGLSAVTNELAQKNGCRIHLRDQDVPMRREVRAVTDLLGIEAFHLACEGRFLCVSSPEHAEEVVDKLRNFNPLAAAIGEVQDGADVTLETRFGTKILSMPSGNIVPRIC